MDIITGASTVWKHRVEKVFVYSIDISTETPGDREGTYGLRRPDGTAKLAWTALIEAEG